MKYPALNKYAAFALGAITLVVGLMFLALPMTFAQDITHLVTPGETTAEVATQYNVTVEALLTANGLTNETELVPGTSLLIPRQVVDIIEPERNFNVYLDPVTIRGHIDFNPDTMQFWKVELKGNNRSAIGSDPMANTPAYDWVTIDTRVDAIEDGIVATIAGYPNLTLGRWTVRIVAVNNDGTFAGIDELSFNVRVPENPIFYAVDYPQEGMIAQPGEEVVGTAGLDWSTLGYRVEMLGGNYITWTPIEIVNSDVANPTVVEAGRLATLPVNLPEGRYQLRLRIIGLDSNDRQPPLLVNFAIGTDAVSNLPDINIDAPNSMNNGRLTVRGNTVITGDVNVPDPLGSFKLEIRDASRLQENQKSRFFDWTTVGEVQSGSVEDGFIGEIAGPPAIESGSYQLRIVVMGRNGDFSAVREYNLTVREPN